MILVVGFLIGVVLAGLVGGVLLVRTRNQLATAKSEVQRQTVRADMTVQSREEALQAAKNAFAELSKNALHEAQESLQSSTQAQLQAAQTTSEEQFALREAKIAGIVKPVEETIAKLALHVEKIETDRVKSFTELSTNIANLATTEQALARETAGLVTALRNPTTRGQWGEIQLRRVIELAGMMENCDFVAQETTHTEDGRIRPDVVVRLPGGKNIVVDSKVPLDAFIRVTEADSDAERKAQLLAHARQVRAHVTQLGSKTYWAHLDSPEFVVMFVPGEALLTAAFEHDIALMEDAVANKVILATPMTLIALLRAVAFGWSQEAMAENAKQVERIGKEIYDRLRNYASKVSDVGKSLDKTVRVFNESVGTLESRVLPGARRFRDLGIGSDDIEMVEQVERVSREIQVAELTAGDLAREI